SKKLPELQEIAKELKVPKYRTQKKLDLVYQILDYQAANPKAVKAIAKEEDSSPKPKQEEKSPSRSDNRSTNQIKHPQKSDNQQNKQQQQQQQQKKQHDNKKSAESQSDKDGAGRKEIDKKPHH